MTDLATAFAAAFRDYQVDGLPVSGKNNPDKPTLRALGALLDSVIASTGADMLKFETVAARDAVDDADDGTLARVWKNNGDEADPANGVYQSDGGVWEPATWYYEAVAAVVQPLVDAGVAEAEAWAEGTEPGGPGTKSAMEHADDAGASAAAAANSAAAASAVVPVNGEPLATIGDEAGFERWAFYDRGLKSPWAQATESQVRRARLPDPATDYSALSRLAQLVHVLIYGQSLATGAYGTPPLSTTATPNAKRFVGGVRSREGNADPTTFYASLVGLTETESTVSTLPYGETVASGMAGMFMRAMLDEDNIDFAAWGQTLLMSAPAEPGETAANLGPAGSFFPVLERDIEKGVDRAADDGLLYGPAALIYLQGEADRSTAIATYITQVLAIRTAAQAAMQTASGIVRDLPMIVYQASSGQASGGGIPRSSLASLQMSETEDWVGLGAVTYPMSYVDGTHMTAAGYRWLGAYLGLALKRWLIDGRKPEYLAPGTPEWGDGWVMIPFTVPNGRMVFDAIAVSNPGNYGFGLRAADGTPITVSGVSIVGPDRLLIQTGSSLPSGAKVSAGHSSVDTLINAGPITGRRTNLRDQQGDRLTWEGKRLDNWCPLFEKVRP